MPRYEIKKWLSPLWRGNEMFYESLSFVGEEGRAPLLCPPAGPIKAWTFGLGLALREGRDFRVEGDAVVRLKGSKAPFWDPEELYPAEPGPHGIVMDLTGTGLDLPGTRYVRVAEGTAYTERQICVRYRHAGSPLPLPPDKSARFPALFRRLKEKRPFTLLFYGDSITVGCNSSGTVYGNFSRPYADSWPVMIKKYFDALGQPLTYVNSAVGGWTSAQGLEAFEERVLNFSPDLLILGFGTNDADLPLSEFKARVREMALRAHEKTGCEVVLVSAWRINPRSSWVLNQHKFRLPLLELEAELPFAAVADVTVMHEAMLERKRFVDACANGINHPNDFVARLYAQVVLRTLFGDRFDFGLEKLPF